MHIKWKGRVDMSHGYKHYCKIYEYQTDAPAGFGVVLFTLKVFNDHNEIERIC